MHCDFTAKTQEWRPAGHPAVGADDGRPPPTAVPRFSTVATIGGGGSRAGRWGQRVLHCGAQRRLLGLQCLSFRSLLQRLPLWASPWHRRRRRRRFLPAWKSWPRPGRRSKCAAHILRRQPLCSLVKLAAAWLRERAETMAAARCPPRVGHPARRPATSPMAAVSVSTGQRSEQTPG